MENIKRHNVLAFPLLWVVTSAEYYYSISENIRNVMLFHTFSSQHFNSEIQMSNGWKK